MTPAQWLDWFRSCLMQKIHRNEHRPETRIDRLESDLRRIHCMVLGRFVIRWSDLRPLPKKYQERLLHLVDEE